MQWRKKFVSALLVGLMVPAGLTVVAAPASAVGGNCSAAKQTQDRIGPDSHRARASCSSLQGDSKARARLNRSGGPDYYSSWFTTRNKYYYTGWYTCYAGCSAQVDIGSV